jgi:glycerol-3-phosphate acyltransferase PlsY
LWVLGRPDLIVVGIPLAALIWWRHQANITRILRGEEPKIGRK